MKSVPCRLRPLALAVFLSLAAAPLPGSAGAAPAAGANVSVRFRVMAWDGEIPDLYYETGAKSTPLGRIVPRRSEFFSYSGPAQITFFQTRPGANGKEERVTVASASLANTGGTPLILLVPDPAGPNRFRALALADDPAGFPPGTFKVQNLTSQNLEAKVDGAEPLRLRPADGGIVRPKPGPDSLGGVQFEIFAGAAKDVIFSNLWVYRADERKLILVVNLPYADGTPNYLVKALDETAAAANTAASPGGRGR